MREYNVLPEIFIPPSVQIFQTITINKFERFYYRICQTIYGQYHINVNRWPRSDWTKHLFDEEYATLRLSWIHSLQNEKRFPSIYYCMYILFIEIYVRVCVKVVYPSKIESKSLQQKTIGIEKLFLHMRLMWHSIHTIWNWFFMSWLGFVHVLRCHYDSLQHVSIQSRWTQMTGTFWCGIRANKIIRIYCYVLLLL